MSDHPKKGTKNDSNYMEKPPINLIPYDAKVEIGKVLGFGQNKYGRAQWTGGIEYSRLLAAAERHMGLFNSGQNLDEESKLEHIAHAAVNLCMLLWMIKNKPEMDDRWDKK